MSLRKCNKCGEMYADSYKTCPFCQEDEAFYNRRGNKRKPQGSGRKSPSIVGPVLILVVVLLLGVGVWHFFGDNIQARFSSGEEGPALQNQLGDTEPLAPPENQESGVAEELRMETVLNMAVGESSLLEPTGGTSYEWSSSDPAVATVTQSGEVKAVAEGTTIVTVTDVSGDTAVCSVTVREAEATGGETAGETSSGGETTGGNTTGGNSSGGSVNLSGVKLRVPDYGITLEPSSEGRFDITMRRSESFTIQLEGVSQSVKWSTGNSSIVTVDENGKLTPVGRGDTTVTGTVGGATVSVLVRVS